MPDNGLGLWLQKECDRNKLSLRAAGEKTGLSHSTIRDIVNGSIPNPDTIRKLANAFSDGNQHEQALENKLSILAGHRTEHQVGSINEPVARLLDIISEFSEQQVMLLVRFADFLDNMEGK